MSFAPICRTLIVTMLTLGAASAAPIPVPVDPGKNAFTGTVDTGVYAIDTATFAKAPDALLAVVLSGTAHPWI